MSKDYMTSGQAAWITYPCPVPRVERDAGVVCTHDEMYAPPDDRGGVALFVRHFTVEDVKYARVDATAMGVYELYCNGHRVGRPDPATGETVYDEMKPGWTDYRVRVLYDSYDLTPYLREGENTLLAAVGSGWYDGRINYGTYGETHVAFLAAIRILDAAGERTLCTDTDWQGAWGSAIRASDIWDGEVYDAREPSPAELSVDGNGIEWGEVETEERDIFVTPHVGPTVRIRRGLTRTPATITIYDGVEDNGTDYGRIHIVRTTCGEDGFTLARGETAVIDLGQNMVGRPTFTVEGKEGTTVMVRVAEMLNDSGSAARGNDNPQGSIYTANYRTARSKALYILRGTEGGETYEPVFTFFGFRYLEFTATEDVTVTSLACPVMGSDTHETGHMETSHPAVNQLISNILWGQRGNYFSIPTDCPQRDERLGWTGDTQAFCGTAAYNADVDGFFHKWLQDVRDSQTSDGRYTDVVPYIRVVGYGNGAWGDAGVIVPYIIWKMYADTDIIEEHYASMERYMDWLATTDLEGPDTVYGDWLAYESTDQRYISMAHYALDAHFMSLMSRAVGKDDRAAHYDAVYAAVREHFQARYCDEAGDLLPAFCTQTGCLLALRLGLLNKKNVPAAAAALKQNIIDNGYKLSTGFVGTPLLCTALAECGENNLAYSLLLQTDNPSWLYSIEQGATTMWSVGTPIPKPPALATSA